MSLHSSKGVEFDVVCMMGLDQGTLPWNNLTPKAKREPRRLFYVGVTRARRVVHMLCSGWITVQSSKRAFAPRSEFVDEVAKSLDATESG
jgi:DNA helicase-2/ATP-dependent DNA helicase PcrA